ncbi:serine/threonine-protein kinase [Streptomyces bicolor]|uniref:serine/threonine-protein kinase n=1 Tax=Streptomyces bicolor TaxID=66874 RepID=UPI00068A6043|nr:serine/threonine-protein kinase [Streptomyces bicolor]
MTEGNGAERLVADRYRLLRRLGAGGMGRVWLAYDELLERQVALKELALPVGIPEQELGARIARVRVEARHAAQLRSHPHVATVHDVVEDNGLPWIVMGFVPGARDLAEVVRDRGPLSPAETARIGVAVLDALMAGHRVGILHRDVKPANILLTGSGAQASCGEEGGQVLLTDYGISLQPDSGETQLTGTSGIIGTPGFLAPERSRGVAPSPASDLFSLGATLYYAVEGTGPFDRPTPIETLTALLFQEPPPPTRAGDLGPVLVGLIAKDPEQRMGADEARRKLAEIAATPHAEPRMQKSAAPTAKTTPLPEEPPISQPLPAAPPAAEAAQAAEAASQPRHPWRSRVPAARVLGVIAAVLLLIGGGIWAGVALFNDPNSKTAENGQALPYGDEVGVTRELKPGDCLHASWPAEKFKGLPELKIVDCKSYPDAQVLDVNANTSLNDARTYGPGICTGLLRDTVRKMVDVQSYALMPSEAGWDNGVRNTICLLFGKTVALYGPVGDYRKIGDGISIENSSIGDCINTKVLAEGEYAFTLADCNKPHNLQGLGYVRAPQSMQWDPTGPWQAIYDLCVNQYGSYKSNTRELFAWADAEDTWNQGFRFVMCLLRMPDETQKLPPGSEVPTSGN